jgi:hypothetical protein
MRYIKLSFIISTVALLVGCVMAPPVPFEGESHASKKLSSDTFAMISMITESMGCGSIDKIYTTVVEPPSGELLREKSKEKWIAYGCDNTYGYEIEFTGDGMGGAYFSVGYVSK